MYYILTIFHFWGGRCMGLFPFERKKILSEEGGEDRAQGDLVEGVFFLCYLYMFFIVCLLIACFSSFFLKSLRLYISTHLQVRQLEKWLQNRRIESAINQKLPKKRPMKDGERE